MGQIKNSAAQDHDEAAAAWARKAEREDIRCSVCGELIDYADEEIHRETGRCLAHAQYARSKG